MSETTKTPNRRRRERPARAPAQSAPLSVADACDVLTSALREAQRAGIVIEYADCGDELWLRLVGLAVVDSERGARIAPRAV